MTERTIIDALLRPKSVAIVGASDDAERVAGRPLAWLRRHGFAGDVYPVNPNRDGVLGERTYRSVSELPEAVDHAYVLLGPERAAQAVRECGQAGVRVVTVLADGFAEAGEAGRARQEELVDAARQAGVRLLGPNSLGVIVPGTGLALSANAALQEDHLPAGRLMLLSQSGSMLGALLSRGAARGIGFSALVSVGNEADLSIGEIGAACAADSGTDAFLLFLEAIRNRDALAGFARAAHAAGKPVLAYKLGRSAAGREAAESHTGALLASDKAADAFLSAHGIARVEQIETLLEAPALFAGRRPEARGRRAAVVSTTGGGGAMVVDRLGAARVEVAGLSDDERAALAKQSIEIKPGRLTDVTLAGTQYDVMHATLRALLDSPSNELVVAAIGSSARFHPDLAVLPVLDVAQEEEKPIAAFTVPEAPDALRRLNEAGIAAFRTPEACADAVRAFLDWRPPAEAVRTAALDLPDMPDTPTEAESYPLLKRLGIPSAPYIVCDGDAPGTLPFGYPVTAKGLISGCAHKTEAGAVRLNIKNGEELAAAVNEIRRLTGAQPVLIQEMIFGLGEVLVGYRDDPQAGPVITLAPGGVLAEIYDDVTVRLAPVNAETARAMIAEVRGLAPLRGYRNLPPGDLAALAEAIARLSQLAVAPSVVEAEINPLIVRREGEGVVAVDALVRRA